MKKTKKEQGPVALCQLRGGQTHPFGPLQGFVSLGCKEEAIYQQLREAVPVLDAAVGKLVRLCLSLDLGASEPVLRSIVDKACAEDLMELKTALEQRMAQLMPIQTQLREGLTPADCKADFVAAGALYALAALSEADGANGMQRVQVGDVTLVASDTSAACESRLT